MRTGKVKASILKRSVFKKIRYKSADVLSCPSAGMDAARLRPADNRLLVCSVNPVTGCAETVGEQAFYRMANDIAAAGAEPSGMLINILLPEGSKESELKNIMEQIGGLAEEYKVDILGGHTEVSPVVSAPLLSVTGMGYAEDGVPVDSSRLVPGMEIVMTKWAGASGAAYLAYEKRKILESRFSHAFLEEAAGFLKQSGCVRDARLAKSVGAAAMHNASADGVFGALWEFGEASGTGFTVDLKKIPIRQETVEICEFFDLNPYMLPSEGVLLAGTTDGKKLVAEYEKAGIAAAVIGTVSEGNDRIVKNGDEARFLVPPGSLA
ncbi:MAG: AIR synthase family protein [Roseburia sp.]|nr:AIR synthase family protein [Roseburia sp.]